MKEITRIHLAKVAYDIELDAKKDIQHYIAALERYADDPELLGDIEIRITELLAERGVVAGGVIAKDDVAAVRAQLGEPSDFALDEAAATVADEPEGTARRVYRDEDDALLGGVLAGFARFFGIDPLWVRLIFIVVLIASFGTALIVYLVLWLIVPPARTAAEKLRMKGQPVTLASIKQLGEQGEPTVNQPARLVRTVVRYGMGAVLTIAAAASLLVTAVIGFEASFGTLDESRIHATEWWQITALCLYVVSGLLFATLCFTLASSLFTRHWSKKTGITAAAIIAVGLVSFASGVGVMAYGAWQERVRISSSIETAVHTLPSTFKKVKTVNFNVDEQAYGNLNVEYIVADTPSYELTAAPSIQPKISTTGDGTSAIITLVRENQKPRWFEGSIQSTLKIYGPALDKLEVESGLVEYRNDRLQSRLEATIKKGGTFHLGGAYETVKAVVESATSVGLNGATIHDLNLTSSGGVSVGVVRSLRVVQPEVCPSNGESEPASRIEVKAVSSGKLTYNGTEQPAHTITTSCGKVLIGDEDIEEGRE